MFVHLRLHSEFSVVDGTNRIDDTVAAAAADGQFALAITDMGNLFGAIKFYKAARGAGVKPVIGAEILLEGLGADASGAVAAGAAGAEPHRLPQPVRVAGAGPYAEHRAQPAGGPVGLAGGAGRGPDRLVRRPGRRGRPGACCRAIRRVPTSLALELAAAFPHRFYLELQRAGRPDDARHVTAAVQLAAHLHLPVVATHPVQFTAPDDYEAHEARVCIADGEILGNPRRVRRFTREQYFKSAAQMAAAVCRPAVGGGQYGRDRPALQPVAGAGQAAAARLSDSAGRWPADGARRIFPPRLARGAAVAAGASVPGRRARAHSSRRAMSSGSSSR